MPTSTDAGSIFVFRVWRAKQDEDGHLDRWTLAFVLR
jgi:hypothetical protein